MKILLAVDGSENSLRAAEYTSFLMENIPGSRVTIMYVDTLSTQLKLKDEVVPSEYENMLEQDTKEILKKAEQIFSDKQLPYNIKIVEGYDVAETICDFAKEYNHEQIIMGTRGLGNIRGIVLGSVSHKVIHIVPCPVTFVK